MLCHSSEKHDINEICDLILKSNAEEYTVTLICFWSQMVLFGLEPLLFKTIDAPQSFCMPDIKRRRDAQKERTTNSECLRWKLSTVFLVRFLHQTVHRHILTLCERFGVI